MSGAGAVNIFVKGDRVYCKTYQKYGVYSDKLSGDICYVVFEGEAGKTPEYVSRLEPADNNILEDWN